MALGIVSPWVDLYREIESIFKKDPKVKVELDNSVPEIKVYVDGQEKADAISKLLPTEKVFGNVVVKITVVPNNLTETPDYVSIFEKAFEGNGAFSRAIAVPLTPQSVGASFILFKKEVVQYPNDDLSDAHKCRSTLYQEIAKDLFTAPGGVYFCTEVDDEDTNKPLGEWP